MGDMIRSFVPDWRDFLWRILVTILLLLVLAGPGVKALTRLVMSFASPIVPVIDTLLHVPF
jgi:hypothetical protein